MKIWINNKSKPSISYVLRAKINQNDLNLFYEQMGRTCEKPSAFRPGHSLFPSDSNAGGNPF